MWEIDFTIRCYPSSGVFNQANLLFDTCSGFKKMFSNAAFFAVGADEVGGFDLLLVAAGV